jgi:hypothetical protein
LNINYPALVTANFSFIGFKDNQGKVILPGKNYSLQTSADVFLTLSQTPYHVFKKEA